MDDQTPSSIVVRWRAGDDQALKALMPLIYGELRQIARRHLRGERNNHTLQTTALIHEAYLRLAGTAEASVQDRRHFVALASRVMRQVLVDHSRGRLAAKRQGGVRVTLSDAADIADGSEVNVVAVDDALSRLSQFDEQQARIVELRFFGGLSILETAAALSISVTTVKREWTMARAWLRSELHPDQP